MDRRLPDSLIAEVAAVLERFYTRTQLENVFLRAGAPGPPPNASSKLKLVNEWLYGVDADPLLDPHAILGTVLQGWMEAVPPEHSYYNEDSHKEWQDNRARMRSILAKHGLSYAVGGKVFGATLSAASRTLDDFLRARDIPAIDIEFSRAMSQVAVDPPAAVTAACAIIEAACKVYIAARELSLPADQSVLPVWKVVQGDLGLAPATIEAQHLKHILGGLAAIVTGVAGLRTRASSAHGHGPLPVELDGSTARLAVHAAHSLVLFLLEHPRWPA